MRITPEDLIKIREPEDLSEPSMAELRAFRDAFQEVEYGLSYVRRVIHGRLDTIMAELHRRSGAIDAEVDLLGILPKVLATNVRGSGLPRPVREMDPPEWADGLLVELDELLRPNELGNLQELSDERLGESAEKIAAFEREISKSRTGMHSRIDRIQDELITRYRNGASVEDLLT